MKIKDVCFSPEFWSDWEQAPQPVRNQLDRKLKTIATHGVIPPSINANKAGGEIDIWIGYVNVGKNSYRILYSVTVTGTMVVERFISHKEADTLFKRL